MVKLRTDGSGKRTWILEGGTLTERLGELATIFNHHSRHANDGQMDIRFLSELLDIETKALVELARRADEDRKAQEVRLKRMENDMAVLKAALEQEIKKRDSIDTPTLDKRRLRPPSSGQG